MTGTFENESYEEEPVILESKMKAPSMYWEEIN